MKDMLIECFGFVFCKFHSKLFVKIRNKNDFMCRVANGTVKNSGI